jgi:hypothetical protein
MKRQHLIEAYDNWQRAPFDQTLRARFMDLVEQWQKDSRPMDECPLHGEHRAHICPEMTLPYNQGL